MLGFISKIFGSKQEKDLNKINSYVTKINEKYKELNTLTNDQLRKETAKLKQYYFENTEKERDEYQTAKENLISNTSIDKIKIREMQLKIKKTKQALKLKSEKTLMEMLPTAFAIVKDTARRFTENENIEVKKTLFDDILLASGRDYISAKGDNIIWKTSWDIMGNLTKWNMIHFDVQLIGGIVLHQGKIAEMATGEGKTLVSTLPIFLNALTGEGVHQVTVNDYLAKRDFYWNRPIFEFHGLSVGCLDLTEPGSYERKLAYNADITYGTNNEFGFDYLRDNMSIKKTDCVQRNMNYAIIDEVDSVLIDDARTPLIMSGEYVDGDTEMYKKLQPIVKKLFESQTKVVNKFLLHAKDGIAKNERTEEIGLSLFRAYRGFPKYKPLVKFLSEPGIKLFMEKNENIYLENNSQRMPEVDKELYFYIEEKLNNVELTDKGYDFLSEQIGDSNFFILPDISIDIEKIENNKYLTDTEKDKKKKELFHEYSTKASRIHIVQQLLKAYTLFEKNVDYIVLDGAVLIIDESTGRILEGRKYSEGLHQALEAKELVKVSSPTKTYATITLQNYFRLYNKLSGMTGTAETEITEFWDIYKLDVVKIPTHKKLIRIDKPDVIYKSKKVKFAAIVDEIVKQHEKSNPVLVGTSSVDDSEMLSRMLQLKGIKHQVLNAKYHRQEAEIISHAGESGAITIATNMAGRGTDIKLDKKSLEAGGLVIIGAEKHESRRVDRQLRGRAGRQGDPGSSQFFISFEDKLMRMTLGNNRTQMFIDSLKDDEVIEGRLVTRAIDNAQKKMEENDFGYRKRLLEYDDVLNKQREKIYNFRRNSLNKEVINSDIYNIIWNVVKNYILMKGDTSEDLKYEDVVRRYKNICNSDYYESYDDFEDRLYNEILQQTYKNIIEKYKNKCLDIDSNIFKESDDKNKKCKFSVSDQEYKINIEADLSGKNIPTIQERAEYLMRLIISNISIFFIDIYWQKHLQKISDLKKSVQNAYYEQTDPLIIFKFESYELFVEMLTSINCDIIKFIFNCEVDDVEIEDGDDTIKVITTDKTDKESLESFTKKIKTAVNG